MPSEASLEDVDPFPLSNVNAEKITELVTIAAPLSSMDVGVEIRSGGWGVLTIGVAAEPGVIAIGEGVNRMVGEPSPVG
jgi:hypothetical protein